MIQIHLCPSAWALYDIWCKLLDARRPKASPANIRAAKAAYVAHRRECKECTPWKEAE